MEVSGRRPASAALPSPDRTATLIEESGLTPELFWTHWGGELTVAGFEHRTFELVAVTIPTTVPRLPTVDVGYVGR
jgi:hypothetical protein